MFESQISRLSGEQKSTSWRGSVVAAMEMHAPEQTAVRIVQVGWPTTFATGLKQGERETASKVNRPENANGFFAENLREIQVRSSLNCESHKYTDP